MGSIFRTEADVDEIRKLISFKHTTEMLMEIIKVVLSTILESY